MTWRPTDLSFGMVDDATDDPVSVLYGEDTDGSDLDLLVDPDDGMTLFDVGAIRWKLPDLLGITVDVATPRALPPRFRDEVLAEAVPV